jgi:hypothetical protein
METRKKTVVLIFRKRQHHEKQLAENNQGTHRRGIGFARCTGRYGHTNVGKA